jgi:hypothetical protein
MQTNSARQQMTRHMTADAKAAMMAARIEASIRDNEAHLAKVRATTAMWQAAHAAGLTPAELHALDMALAHGAAPTDLLRTIDPRSDAEREQDAAAADWQAQVAHLRACM